MPCAVPAQDAITDGIIVRGERPIGRHEVVGDLERVLAITGNGQVARWSGRLCVETIGLDPTLSRFMVERVREVAGDVRLSVRAGRNCQNRAMILFTDDWPGLVAALRVRRSPFADRLVPPSRDVPIQWFGTSELRGADGERPTNYYIPAAEGGTPRSFPGVNAHVATKLATGGRMDVTGVTVVVDAGHLGSVTNGALASFLAMVLIGNVRPDHGTPERTSILNLFAAPARAPAEGILSMWDRRYLAALYAGIGNLDATHKQAAMISAMAR